MISMMVSEVQATTIGVVIHLSCMRPCLVGKLGNETVRWEPCNGLAILARQGDKCEDPMPLLIIANMAQLNLQDLVYQDLDPFKLYFPDDQVWLSNLYQIMSKIEQQRRVA